MDRQTRAKRIVDLHVFYGQNEVVGELIRAGKIDEEYTYPFVDTEEEVGTYHQRTGCLHGRRDTEDCRRVKLSLHIDMAKMQITEIRGFAIPRRFCNL